MHRTWAAGKYKSNLADNLELIKEVGYKNVMVDTDGGQTENPHWELALAEYMQYLVDSWNSGRTRVPYDTHYSGKTVGHRRIGGRVIC